jgi:hypothetical protein
MDEDFLEGLKEFSYYKSLVVNEKTSGRNVIIELKDGTNQVVNMSMLSDKYFLKWEQIERITVFIKTRENKISKPIWHEYEFVASQ